MKLYMVHCGYYDQSLFGGIYEQHANFFVVAGDMTQAKIKAKQNPEYKRLRMHIDGLQEIESINGYRIEPVEDKSLDGFSKITNCNFRSLAPQKSSSEVNI